MFVNLDQVLLLLLLSSISSKVLCRTRHSSQFKFRACNHEIQSSIWTIYAPHPALLSSQSRVYCNILIQGIVSCYRENSITIWLQSTNHPPCSPAASENWWVFKLTFLLPLDTPLSFLFATLKRNIPTLSPYHSPSCLFLCYVWIILIDAHFSLERIF